jgi:hypothetical protein
VTPDKARLQDTLSLANRPPARAESLEMVHQAAIFFHMGVSTAPGQMQFEVILCAASAWAALRVMLTTPALLAA